MSRPIRAILDGISTFLEAGRHTRLLPAFIADWSDVRIYPVVAREVDRFVVRRDRVWSSPLPRCPADTTDRLALATAGRDLTFLCRRGAVQLTSTF